MGTLVLLRCAEFEVLAGHSSGIVQVVVASEVSERPHRGCQAAGGGSQQGCPEGFLKVEEKRAQGRAAWIALQVFCLGRSGFHRG